MRLRRTVGGSDVSPCFKPEQLDHAAFPPPTPTAFFFSFLLPEMCFLGGAVRGLCVGEVVMDRKEVLEEVCTFLF